MIGAGYFSRFHYDAWHRLPDAAVVAVCDRDLAKARAAAGSGVPVFDDAERMLATVDADLIDIATPPASHRELVALGCARGLPMICQKPLADTLAEAEALTALADASGVPLIVHENFRFMPWYREIARLLADGAIGRPLDISFRLRPGDGQGPDAYLARQPYFQTMPRFLVHETAIHLIDVFRFLLGEITGVYARLRQLNPAIAGEDAGHILFDFVGGASGTFDGNRLIDHPAGDPRLTMGTMMVEGEAGTLRLDGDGRLWRRGRGQDEHEHRYPWNRDGFGGDCVMALQAHVLAHLRSDAPVENRARDYLRNLAVEEAAYRSHAERRWMVIGT